MSSEAPDSLHAASEGISADQRADILLEIGHALMELWDQDISALEDTVQIRAVKDCGVPMEVVKQMVILQFLEDVLDCRKEAFAKRIAAVADHIEQCNVVKH